MWLLVVSRNSWEVACEGSSRYSMYVGVVGRYLRRRYVWFCGNFPKVLKDDVRHVTRLVKNISNYRTEMTHLMKVFTVDSVRF